MTSTELELRPEDVPDRKGRDGKGRWSRTIETVERDVELARMKARGMSYPQIATVTGMAISSIHEAVKRALEETIREPAEEVKAAELHRLEVMLDRYEGMRDTIIETLARKHYTVSHGRLVYKEGEEEPLEDDGFVLAAVESLRRVEESKVKVLERRAKYLGLDAAQKVQVDVGVRYEIIGVDMSAMR